MLKSKIVSSVALVALVCSALTFAGLNADDKKKDEVDFTKIPCVMNAKAKAKKANSAEYKGGKVYTCCGGCLAKFKKSPEKFATAANHQLVATKQFTQVKCPISGGKINPEKTAKVGGVEVAFCCGNCQGKVAKAEGDKAKAAIVFSEAAFKKGFTAKK